METMFVQIGMGQAQKQVQKAQVMEMMINDTNKIKREFQVVNKR